MNINRFSWRRMWAYTRAVTLSDKKAIGMRIGAFAGISLLVYFLANFWFFFEGKFHSSNVFAARVIIIVAASILGVWRVSGSFKLYLNPKRSSALLMLPVTKGEKFVHAFFYNVIVIPLALVTVIFLNDALWSVFFDMQTLWSHICEIIAKSFIFEKGHITGWAFYYVALAMAMPLAFFFLGAIFFRRRQFLYTILALFALSTALSTTMTILFKILAPFEWWTWWHINIPPNIAQGIGLLVQAFFLFGLFYWAWRRFSKLQITK